MMEWEEVKLGDFVQTISKTYNFANKEKVIFLNTGDIKDGKFLVNDYSSIKELPGQAKKSIRKNDILYSEIRPANKRFAFVDFDASEYVVSTKLLVLRVDSKIAIPQYIYQYLTSRTIVNRLQYLAESRSGTFPQITFSEVSELPIALPPLKKQKEIYSIIKSLDDKISLLRQQNETLEQLAQTLFKRWFVDFEFPDAQGQPYKSAGGKMIESELGEIPEGWEVSTLKSITNLLTRGIAPKYLEEGGISVVNQRCIRDKSINFALCRRHNNEIRSAKSKLIQVGDVLVNSTGVGTLGRTAIVKRLEEKLTTVDTHVTILRPKIDKVHTLFFGYLITTKEREIEYLGEGSTGQTELSRIKLGEKEVILPLMEIQNKFSTALKSSLEKVAANEQQIQTLTRLRDTLLPKLMSGELRLGE